MNGVIPRSYPNKGSFSVVSDGVKTTAQIANELYNGIDWNKMEYGRAQILVNNLPFIWTDGIQGYTLTFVRTWGNTTHLYTEMYKLSSNVNSCGYEAWDITTSQITSVSDKTSPISAGTIYTFVYL